MAEFTFAPLTPASFLDRAAAVFADRIAIVDGERTFTYRDMSDRCRRLTGALAVMYPNGYIEIRDRSKDIIISGGENIASVEVEQVLDSHPSVVESAVVGMPHDRWGEVPVAFVTLRNDVDADALTEYARERLARYKVPKRFDFGDLPKTSTGKIQKNVLRDRAHELYESS